MLSNTTFAYLLENQKKLDHHILKKFKLDDEQTLDKRILAFLIELAEFINEQRDFKYWSVKTASEQDILLEEYIDGIHFLISIGSTLQVDFNKFHYQNKYSGKVISLTKLYLECFDVCAKLIKKKQLKFIFKF